MFHRNLSAAGRMTAAVGAVAAMAASTVAFSAETAPPAAPKVPPAAAQPPAAPKAVHPPAAPPVVGTGGRKLPQTAAGLPADIPPGARVTGQPPRTRVSREATMRIFELLDLDKDGKLSRDEAPEVVKAAFAELDLNKDGFVGPDDVQAPRPIDPQRMANLREQTRTRGAGGLLQYDANKDGKIEASELPPKMSKVIQRLDKNGDGVLSGEELQGAAPATPPANPASAAPPLPGAVPPAPPAAPGAPAAKGAGK